MAMATSKQPETQAQPQLEIVTAGKYQNYKNVRLGQPNVTIFLCAVQTSKMVKLLNTLGVQGVVKLIKVAKY